MPRHNIGDTESLLVPQSRLDEYDARGVTKLIELAKSYEWMVNEVHLQTMILHLPCRTTTTPLITNVNLSFSTASSALPFLKDP